MSTFHIGLDVGSTTVKLVVLNNSFNIMYKSYTRHFSDIKKTIIEVLTEGYRRFKNDRVTIMVTGSGGLSVKDWLDISFIQEVIASTKSIQTLIPETEVAIELGGEDAKITYLSGNIEQRMNSICAGGTGAFIDQMASLLETDAEGLNTLAASHKTVYSIASRCGVFAKTDIQALINQGALKEDIAVSVLQSVVNQTISNLACGRAIKGKVAFLGGPLHFLFQLRERFIKTLNLSDDEIIYPEDPQLYVAIGAAIGSVSETPIEFKTLKNKLQTPEETNTKTIKQLEPLFKDEKSYEEFKHRHQIYNIKELDPKEYTGSVYLGIDAGSTTTKAVLISQENKVLYSYYGNNKGKPLDQSISIVKEIYKEMPHLPITYSCVTGYGEDFIKAALGIDEGEVETLAHYKGAKLFQKDVDFILDIGGQDMKSMKIENGVIDDILLNEACSSGCGSFIETFAKNVNMSVGEFLESALFAKNPVDLGSRCTVFMNSMVKQAQKEGATVGDIAAGLSYSVIKNALQKVIKIRDPKELGEKIVVQGGTFYGDAILRTFEIISGREAIRPNLTGLMGALGSAIIAKERYSGKESGILKSEQLNSLTYKSIKGKCGRCTNNCQLTINKFSDGTKYITGNRCEKAIGIQSIEEELPNLYEYKYRRTFDYQPLPLENAPRGRVGIPRVLNIFENYPFWSEFFKNLGFSVELSCESSRRVYEKGLASIPSETACYPAKMVHGHIMDLIEKELDFIFYPSVFYEKRESSLSDDHLNCPVVTGYPELIKTNIVELKEKNIKFLNPFITFDHKKSLEKELYNSFKEFNISEKEIVESIEKGFLEMEKYKLDIKNKSEETLKYIKEQGIKGIVLGGRPYHIDGGLNHGIPELITSLGMAVLTEDSVEHLAKLDEKLRVLDQWTYHSRLYRAAKYVSENKNLELIQLNSFGCGLDSVSMDQVQEILYAAGKISTGLRIDEISNLGAAKIRVRSLKAALEEKDDREVEKKSFEYKVRPFTKEDKKNHTILIPQMAPIHFRLIEKSLKLSGYRAVLLETYGNEADEGLKYVNNDACYPSIIVVGQFLAALKSGKYDLDNTSLILTQTGGVCRASNYVAFLRKALKEAGFEKVPVISISTQDIEKNPGFKFSPNMTKRCIVSILLGDLLTRVSLRVRPYEKIQNSTDILVEKWMENIEKELKVLNKNRLTKLVNEIVESFDNIEVLDIKKPKVAIAGEILIKYHPGANNQLVKILEEEGAEVVVGDITDFLLYCLYNADFKNKNLGKSYKAKVFGDLGIKYIEHYREPIRKALDKSNRFTSPITIQEIGKKAEELISLGNQSGEGWLLTGEMIELVSEGVENIICVQPFGCLPNHITGKGMIKGIRDIYPNANIAPIDYDPGASVVNQINRIKLMLSTAKENIEKDVKTQTIAK
ncbi:2-hydroxyacyl-CoA dehydratase [Tissierella creatinophila]|uniref:R-phenyllactate dehydratase activator n=1 Tax=Tissierella creatinophila DSM 6911 TaxID=1123403 RepID=A0A1U7M8V4_TISCR|nr:2-hydroxyacyl-CoA dehydratase [Tissierella creatinophila]OLS03715.1 R-phenyllactate dehydratase activator [Tissierella creatinophila DSM 6911]